MSFEVKEKDPNILARSATAPQKYKMAKITDILPLIHSVLQLPECTLEDEWKDTIRGLIRQASLIQSPESEGLWVNEKWDCSSVPIEMNLYFEIARKWSYWLQFGGTITDATAASPRFSPLYFILKRLWDTSDRSACRSIGYFTRTAFQLNHT